ncbi:MAG: mechanosensitive ion channel [Planctomycetales bacterium]|nr:mechanosensitive ion channel [Planctomycetales bacterium]
MTHSKTDLAKTALAIALAIASFISTASVCRSQEIDSDVTPKSSEPASAEPPAQVDINPEANDSEIAARLTRILNATGWFAEARVRVDEGVAFLDGMADDEKKKDWASKLASNTQDVVAVANNLEIRDEFRWDFTPAWKELDQLRRNMILAVPALVVSLAILALSYFVAKLVAKLARRIASRRTGNQLLRDLTARALAVPVVLVGIYLALRVAGLTRLAATVLGGTGLIGLILGIAFRDIAENFLASLLLSVKQPFRAGDLVLVEGRKGYIQSVTTRGTTLMTLDGNHVQIPNATIYKSVIENFTSNPNVRQDFVVGIDYDDSISAAQDALLEVLRDHEAVLADPEPLVLLEELAASSVDLRVIYWIDGTVHSGPKVRSSIIRLCKRALTEHGFTMPDAAREVIFPRSVPIEMIDHKSSPEPAAQRTRQKGLEDDATTTSAEGALNSEAATIEDQARNARAPEEGIDLLAQ